MVERKGDIVCRSCGAALVPGVERDAGVRFERTHAGATHVQRGAYAVIERSLLGALTGELVVHPEDAVGTVRVADATRLVGCCGPDGNWGRNRSCRCGAEVGTERTACWQAQGIFLDPRAVRLATTARRGARPVADATPAEVAAPAVLAPVREAADAPAEATAPLRGRPADVAEPRVPPAPVAVEPVPVQGVEPDAVELERVEPRHAELEELEPDAHVDAPAPPPTLLERLHAQPTPEVVLVDDAPEEGAFEATVGRAPGRVPERIHAEAIFGSKSRKVRPGGELAKVKRRVVFGVLGFALLSVLGAFEHPVRIFPLLAIGFVVFLAIQKERASRAERGGRGRPRS